MVISKEARDYKTTVNKLSHKWEPRRLEGRLFLQIMAYPPDRRRRDLDNLLKVTIDSIESAGLFDDDSQIDDLHIRRKSPVEGGKLECLVGRMDQWLLLVDRLITDLNGCSQRL